MVLQQHVETVEGLIFDLELHTKTVFTHKFLTEIGPAQLQELKHALGAAVSDFVERHSEFVIALRDRTTP